MDKPNSSPLSFIRFSSNLFFRIRLLLSFCFSKLWIPRLFLSALRDAAYDDEVVEDEASSHYLSEDTVLIMDGSCPMLVPVHIVTSMIKNRIPVLEFGDYVERRRLQRRLDRGEDETGDDPSGCCAVCLGTIEWGDVIREPSNCDHVFHRECLDRWIGEQRVTCPLCRCMMLPSRRNITFC